MLRVVFILLLGSALPAAASAASYHGRSVDGPRFSASIKNEDAGTISHVEVKFWGRNVTVFVGGRTLNWVLDEEEISDPLHIVASDDLHGTQWEIEVRNLRETSPASRDH